MTVLLLAFLPGVVHAQENTSNGQRVALWFVGTSTVVLLGWVIWLKSALARVAVRRLMGGLTAPLLSSPSNHDDEEGHEPQEDRTPDGVELETRTSDCVELN
jgi:hypothetical protein